MLQMTWQTLYPFTSRWHDLNGVQMHYVDEGESTADPILMVHGNPTWSFYWRNLITPLRKEARAIAVDHVGCGLSNKPQRYPYSLTQHSDNLIHFIETLNLRNITLVAHDWGGPIGLRAALALRERFARIVLLNTGAFPPPFFPWRIRICRTPLLGRIAVQGFNLFARAATWMAVQNHERMTPQVKSGLLHPYGSWSQRQAIYEFVRDIPARKSHPSYAPLDALEKNLHKLSDLPALLIWGMRDWCFRPQCLERLQEILPQAQSVKLTEVGHYVMEDAHEEVVHALGQFLNNHALKKGGAR